MSIYSLAILSIQVASYFWFLERNLNKNVLLAKIDVLVTF